MRYETSAGDFDHTPSIRPPPTKLEEIIERMKRSTSSLALLVFSGFVAVLLGSSSLAESGNCQDKLVGSAYQCTYSYFFPGSGGGGIGIQSKDNCVEFATGGLSENFDWVGVLGDLSTSYGCTCQMTGSFRSPSFGLTFPNALRMCR